MDAAEARIASLKSRLLCPGVRGAAYQHLYACSPQGVLHPSDVAAACTGDSCMDDDRAALEASVCVWGGGSERERDTKLGLKLTFFPWRPTQEVLKRKPLPAFYGEADCLRSVICSVAAQPGGKPCPACSELLKQEVHQLTRKGKRAAARVAGAENGVIAPPWQIDAQQLGRSELVAHLQAASAELGLRRAANTHLAQEVMTLATRALAPQHDLQVKQQPRGQELLELLHKAYTGNSGKTRGELCVPRVFDPTFSVIEKYPN